MNIVHLGLRSGGFINKRIPFSFLGNVGIDGTVGNVDNIARLKIRDITSTSTTGLPFQFGVKFTTCSLSLNDKANNSFLKRKTRGRIQRGTSNSSNEDMEPQGQSENEIESESGKNQQKQNKKQNTITKIEEMSSKSWEELEDYEEYEDYDDEGEYYEPEEDEPSESSGTISLRNSQSTLEVDLKLVYQQLHFLLKAIGKDDHDVSLWLTTNEIIQDYNQQYRGVNKATDILSFPFHTYLSPEVIDPNSTFPGPGTLGVSLMNNGDDMDDVDLDDDLDEEADKRDKEWDIDYDEDGNIVDKSEIEYDEDEKEMMRLLNNSLKKEEFESQLLSLSQEQKEETQREGEDNEEEDDDEEEEDVEEALAGLSMEDLEKLGISLEGGGEGEWTRLPPGYVMKDLGDMIISIDYVIAQCKDDELNSSHSEERGASGAMAKCGTVQERIPYLLIHGLLHLQGYDHESDEDYELMVRKEEELIAKFKKEFTFI